MAGLWSMFLELFCLLIGMHFLYTEFTCNKILECRKFFVSLSAVQMYIYDPIFQCFNSLSEVKILFYTAPLVSQILFYPIVLPFSFTEVDSGLVDIIATFNRPPLVSQNYFIYSIILPIPFTEIWPVFLVKSLWGLPSV